MSGRQLRAALAAIVPDDLPASFPLRRGVTVYDPDAFLRGLRAEAEAGRSGWQGDLRAALEHLEDPDGFRPRYEAQLAEQAVSTD